MKDDEMEGWREGGVIEGEVQFLKSDVARVKVACQGKKKKERKIEWVEDKSSACLSLFDPANLRSSYNSLMSA